ncbi:hypothetical protein RUND412_010896 [Rhizina undulata]
MRSYIFLALASLPLVFAQGSSSKTSDVTTHVLPSSIVPSDVSAITSIPTSVVVDSSSEPVFTIQTKTDVSADTSVVYPSPTSSLAVISGPGGTGNLTKSLTSTRSTLANTLSTETTAVPTVGRNSTSTTHSSGITSSSSASGSRSVTSPPRSSSSAPSSMAGVSIDKLWIGSWSLIGLSGLALLL